MILIAISRCLIQDFPIQIQPGERAGSSDNANCFFHGSSFRSDYKRSAVKSLVRPKRLSPGR
jgi:hypothetical protein